MLDIANDLKAKREIDQYKDFPEEFHQYFSPSIQKTIIVDIGDFL
jgi:hypothetical protein